MFFRYLYGDLYAGAIWAGVENPENSGNYTTSQIPFSCARDSPLICVTVSGSTLPSLGYIFSFGEDNNKDVYILASSGVYRVVRPSRCSYSCSKENLTDVPSPTGPTSPTSEGSQLNRKADSLLLISLYLLIVIVGIV